VGDLAASLVVDALMEPLLVPFPGAAMVREAGRAAKR